MAADPSKPGTSKAGTGARKRGRPPASDSAATRERVLEAALRQFAVLGYDATTNKDIARTAGITTGAIYHYFASKRDLYAAVLEFVQEQVFARFGAAVAEQAKGAGLRASLHAVIDEAVRIEQEQPELANFLVSVPTEARRHPEIADLAPRQQSWSENFFGQLVADRRKDLARGVDPETATALLRMVAGGLARFATIVQLDVYLRSADGLKRLLDGALFKEGK